MPFLLFSARERDGVTQLYRGQFRALSPSHKPHGSSATVSGQSHLPCEQLQSTALQSRDGERQHGTHLRRAAFPLKNVSWQRCKTNDVGLEELHKLKLSIVRALTSFSSGRQRFFVFFFNYHIRNSTGKCQAI